MTKPKLMNFICLSVLFYSFIITVCYMYMSDIDIALHVYMRDIDTTIFGRLH